MARQHAAGQTQVHEERAKECTASRGGGSAAPSGREPPSRRMASESPATRPGISYSVEDCRGRWSYMVSEGSPHIRRGYRLGLSFSQCIRSMFQLHNETINVWSHLAGAILFVCLVFYVKDSSAFERPRAMVESVVGSIPFQGRFNVSIFEEEFCGPDDGAEKRENGSNCTAAHDIGNRTMKCKRRNEEMAFSAARRHFAAAKNILQHVELKLPGLDRLRDMLDPNVVGVRVAQEAEHVQRKLHDTMRNLEESLDTMRQEMALLGSTSMEGCVVCWLELVRRLAGVRAALQDQMASINSVTLGLHDKERIDGKPAGGEEEGVWGLSAREWADYTMSEVASVTTALNNGIAASKRALTHASSRLHHDLLQDVYNQMSEMRGFEDVLQDIFPQRLLEQGVEEASMERWPIVMFLLSAFTCLTFSASYHLFNCHSIEVSNLLLLLDYAGISILIGGSFLPPIYYGFYCDTHLRNVYLALISVLSLFSCFVGLYSGIWPNVHLKFVRVIAYSANALFAIVPCGHLLVRFLQGQPCCVSTLLYITAMLGLYALGSCIYFYQFPEKYYPGRFDLIFSSHQLWHMIVFAAAFMHYYCAVGHFHWRVENRCMPITPMP